MIRQKHNQKLMGIDSDGYMVLMVVMVVALISLVFQALFYKAQGAGATGGMTLQKQKIAYLAEGVTQVINKFAQDYVGVDPAPTTAGLNTFVSGKLAGIDVAPYVIQS